MRCIHVHMQIHSRVTFATYTPACERAHAHTHTNSLSHTHIHARVLVQGPEAEEEALSYLHRYLDLSLETANTLCAYDSGGGYEACNTTENLRKCSKCLTARFCCQVSSSPAAAAAAYFSCDRETATRVR